MLNKFVLVLKIILYPIYRVLFWYSVEGKENIPKEKGAVFCSNHISVLDPVLWIIGVRRSVHFMCKEEMFHNPVMAWFLKKCDVFPIVRGAKDMQSIGNAISIVEQNGIVGIYPEGTRSKDGKPGRAKSGVAFIANAAKADVIPAAVICKGRLRPFKRVKLVIGKPIPYAEIQFDEHNRNNLHRVSSLIMDHIREIWENGQNEW